MASVVDICNLALSHVGDSANVASISPPDGSKQAALCSQFYPVARDEALEAHTWSCATVRAAGAVVTNQSTSWAYAYAQPANALRIVSVLPTGYQDEETDTQAYILEQDGSGNGVIYTNTPSAILRFIVRVTDTTKFSTMLVMAISRRLASYLAGPLLKGKVGYQVGQAQNSAYDSTIGSAKELDANQQKKDTLRDYQPQHLLDRSLPDRPRRNYRQ